MAEKCTTGVRPFPKGPTGTCRSPFPSRQAEKGQAMKILVAIHPDETGGFWAEVPAMPGCITEGDTREELLANLREALEGCLLVKPGGYEPEPGGTLEEVDL